jgi:hypothetical protein
MEDTQGAYKKEGEIRGMDFHLGNEGENQLDREKERKKD